MRVRAEPKVSTHRNVPHARNFDTNSASIFDPQCKRISTPDAPPDDRSQRREQSPNSSKTTSWSLTPPDGAYAAVPAWSSARAWLALVAHSLTSDRATKLREKRISVGSVMLVARADMATADVRTGRGVSTSHQTVAQRLGMSRRTVGEARRLLEKLGLATTIVMGRHLSPAERSQARQAHGGYQEAAPSVRALTMPRHRRSVDTCHLPRRGSDLKKSPVEKLLTTRAEARRKTSARPGPNTQRARRIISPGSPRSIDIQRFAWAVARNYGLDSGSPTTRIGALHGGRHIGQLCNILERYNVTPERYTLATLRIEIDEALAASHIRPLENGQKRDRIAYFAWMLGMMRTNNPGETRLERQMRDHTHRMRQRRDHFAATRAAAEQQQLTANTCQTGRHAITEDLRHHPPLQRARKASDRGMAAKALVLTLIGTSQPLYAAPARTQQLVGAISTLGRMLADQRWHSSHDAMARVARWSRPDTGGEIAIKIRDPYSDVAQVIVQLPRLIQLPPDIEEQICFLQQTQWQVSADQKPLER